MWYCSTISSLTKYLISSQAAAIIIIKTEGALNKDLNLASLFLESDFLFTGNLRIVEEYQKNQTIMMVGQQQNWLLVQQSLIILCNLVVFLPPILHNNRCTKQIYPVKTLICIWFIFCFYCVSLLPYLVSSCVLYNSEDLYFLIPIIKQLKKNTKYL